jgi:sugar phosphate permease
VLTVLIAATSACAILTGAAIGLGSLFAARFLLGIAEAGAFPVASRGMQLWFAPAERGRIQGVTHFFSRFRGRYHTPDRRRLLIAYGWRVMFFVFGAIGFVWVAAFWWSYRDRPEDHPHVNREELAEIRGVSEDGQIKPLSVAKLATPWRRILTTSEHVVDRARLLLLLLRQRTSISPGIRRICASTAACQSPRSGCGGRFRSSPACSATSVGGSLSD